MTHDSSSNTWRIISTVSHQDEQCIVYRVKFALFCISIQAYGTNWTVCVVGSRYFGELMYYTIWINQIFAYISFFRSSESEPEMWTHLLWCVCIVNILAADTNIAHQKKNHTKGSLKKIRFGLRLTLKLHGPPW